ncbi:MAG: SdrD B-like domain-containing protein [Patescibacteria group bacterium]
MKKIKIKIHSEKLFSYVAMFSMVANILSPFAAVLPASAYAEGTSSIETTQQIEEEKEEPSEEPKEEAPAEEVKEEVVEQSTEKGSTEETQEPIQEETTELEAAVESSNEIPEDTFTVESLEEPEVITEETPAEPVVEEPVIVEEQPGDILPDGVTDYRPEVEIEGSETTEVQEVVDPVSVETSSTEPEVVITEPSGTEPAVVVEPVTPVEEAPKEVVKEYETLEDGAEVKDSTKEDWDIDGEKAETKEVVKLGIKYIFPIDSEDNEVSVTFTKLPKLNEDKSILRIERVKVSDLDLPEDFKTDAEYAFDITTPDMDAGEFEYDLILPKPEGVDAGVSYTEKSIEEIKSEGLVSDNLEKIDEDKIDQSDKDVAVEGLDHFTTYFVDTYESNVTTPKSTYTQGEIVYAEGISSDAQTIRLKFKNNSGTTVQTCAEVYGTETTCNYTLPVSANTGTWSVQIERKSNENWSSKGTATFVVVALQPDLTAEKTNNIGGNATVNQPFNWKIHIVNRGFGSAVFNSGETILTDNLPSSGVTYGSPSVLNRSGVTGIINCSISSNDLSCTASGSVTINVGGSLDVSWSVTPTVAGSLENPRSSAYWDNCEVDPDWGDWGYDVIDESNEDNNTCSNTVSVAVAQPVDNPDLTQACGLDIALIIDNSTSIDSGELTQIKNAMTSFTNALSGTPTQFSVTKFATTASVVRSFTNDIANVNNAINAIPVGGGYTNWEDGFVKGWSTFDPRSNPNLVIFASDGNPNRVDNGTSVSESQAVSEAQLVANSIKSAGIRILALGIGNELDTPNLQAISGNSVNTGNVLTSDVITSNFDELAADLAEFASQTCGGTITVNKYIGSVAPENRAGASWEFNIAGTTKLTDNNGQTVAVKVSAGSGYSVTEASVLPGYTFSSASCTGATNNGSQSGNGVSGIQVGNSDIVSCNFVNTENYTPTGICHATDSHTNPYVSETPATLGQLMGHADHDGPVWYSGITVDWGDIIPPIPVFLPSGLNWTTEGQAILNNNCNIPPTTGTLIVIKNLINGNGGTKGVSNFSFSIDGNSAVAFEADGRNDVTVNAGVHTVTEPSVGGYSTTYSNCTSVNVPAGGTATCTITNDDQAPTITLIKSVTNDNGGNAGGNDFGLTIGESPATSGVAYPVMANTSIAISEAGLPGYSFVSITGNGCPSSLGGTVTLNEGQNITCTITNDDIQPKLTVTKVVENGSHGTKVVSDFPLFVDSTSVLSGVQNGFNAGTYTISETGQEGYSAVISGDCAPNDGSITLNVGDIKACTITNTSQYGKIVIEKQTLPDGNSTTFDFTGDVAGTISDGGRIEKVVVAGAYSVAETVPTGWDLTSIACTDPTSDSGTSATAGNVASINVADNETVTCVFTNTQKGSIWGSKYNDLNSSGNRDTVVGSDNTEPGLSGWTITLKYPSGSVLGIAQTDSRGDYEFKNLVSGDYTVCETQQTGWLNTDPSDSLCKQVTLNPGQSVNANFGNKQNPIVIKAYKVICDDESYLPDWGNGGPSDVTSTTAQDWVGNSDGHCRLEPNWKFQWSYDGVGNPGDNIISEAGTGWNTFGATAEITQLDTPKLWFREVLQDGYIPFTYGAHSDNSDNVSAEFYCNNDVLNYDNWEWIDNPQFGNTYYCVAWNTLKTGSLKVTKTVDWTGITPDTSKTFEICITGPSYTSGSCKTTDFDGETLVWDNLLLGDYTITETNPGALWSVAGSGDEVSVGFGTSATHQITNAYIPYCGDGARNGTEQCDGTDGVATDGSEFCTSQCKLVPIYDGQHQCPRETIEKYVGGITLGSQSSSLQTLNLLGGKSYLLKAFGTYQYGTGSTRKADPAYGSEDNFATWRSDIGIWGVNNKGVTSILGNLGRGMGVIEWDSDENIDEDHIYEKLVEPESDLEAKFVISDWYSNWYGNSCDNQKCMDDNNGSLNVDLYECVEPSSIQGKKFKDVNGNGTRDSGDTYLDGWTINLYQQGEGWNLVKNMVTGNDSTEAGPVDQGQYRFINLLPGKYLVCEELKSGWMQTAPVEGTSYNGTTCYEIDLAAGKSEVGKVFGNFELGKVQGMKFNDLDGDRNSHETGEDYLNGWKVRLYKDWADPIEVITSNTGTLGQYKFEDLKPGTYQVCEVLQQGWIQTWPSAGDIPVGDNGVTHSNYGTAVINSSGALDEGATCWETVVSTSGQFNQLLRFGNSNLGSISGMKYIDNYGDGNFDGGTDWGASGWTINLYKLVEEAYVLASSVSTDSSGYYSFTNLEQGTYKLEEVQQPTYQVINPSTGTYEGIVLNPGNNLTDYNFGNFHKGSAYGCKYNDLNSNGTRESTLELQMGGVTMNLYDSSWKLIGSTITSEGTGYGNNYSFSNLLEKGTYYICEVMWEGWAQTEPILENGVLNTSPNASNEGSICRRVDNNYSSGNYPSQRFGNTFVNPELQISKSNNASSAKRIGDVVKFTIKIKVLDSKLNDVKVLDLLPKGFTFQDGDWDVESTNPLFSLVNIPHYASPGTWELGDLEKDEEVTITYKAKIESDVDPGIYKDLAWTSGDDILDNNVLGLAQDGKINDYFVGTEVEVVKDKEPVKDSVDVEETEEEEEEEEQVLGASDVRLPATGASTAILNIVMFVGLVGGLLMMIGGIGQMIKVKKKKVKNTRMKKALLSMLVLGFGLILTSKVYAADSKLVARIEEPTSPVTSSFNLNFVVLDANETLRDIYAQCQKKGPLDSSDFIDFGPEISIGNLGDSYNCDVNSSVLNKSGTYEFKVKVRANGGDWQDAINEASVEFDNEGPDKPKYIEKDKKSDCKYKIELKTADDSQTSYIEIYRDDDKEMNLNLGNLIETKTIGPDEKYEFTDEVYSTDCAKTWYYAVIAFDDSGNASDPRAEEVVTTVTVTRTKTETEEVLGALEVPGGANIPGEGGETNEEKSAETGAGSEGGTVLGEKTQEQGFGSKLIKSPWFWLLLIVLAYITARVIRKQNKKK